MTDCFTMHVHGVKIVLTIIIRTYQNKSCQLRHNNHLYHCDMHDGTHKFPSRLICIGILASGQCCQDVGNGEKLFLIA